MTVEELKKDRPDLVLFFEQMNYEQLMIQCYRECIDAIQMQQRVAVFMEECTIDMSHTNYTVDALKSMISDRQEADIIEFCYETSNDHETDQELANAIRDKATEL